MTAVHERKKKKKKTALTLFRLFISDKMTGRPEPEAGAASESRAVIFCYLIISLTIR